VNEWVSLTGREFEETPKDVAILPVGSLERHGDHLPLGTDILAPEWIARQVASKLREHGVSALVMPTVPYGSSRILAKFPGTVSADDSAFREYVKSVLKEALRNGFKLVLVVNGHGGNTSLLREAARDAAYSTNGAVLLINWWTDVAQDKRKSLFPEETLGHAGADETAVMMAISPDLVKMEYLKKNPVKYPALRLYCRKYEEEILFPEALSGDPSAASPEKGKELLTAVVDGITDSVLRALKLIQECG